MLDWERIRAASPIRGRSEAIRRQNVLVLAMCMLLTAALWGCGTKLEAETMPDEPKSWQRTIKSGVQAPLPINYIVNNPLTIDEVKEGDGEEFTYTYLTVSGLKDQEVQKKINNRIKEVYDQLRIQDLPPYRGIKVYVPEGYTIASEQIYSEVQASFNNILSVVFYKHTTWQPPGFQGDPDEKSFYEKAKYVSECEMLNFDLNTGQELKLADLFCENVEPSEIVNDYMEHYLSQSGADEEGFYRMMSSGNMKLVESFKGLSEDQKFGVYPFGIILVFDYLTPQFETRFSANTVVISFGELGDVFGFTKAFSSEGKEESLYISTEPDAKSLVLQGKLDEVSGEDTYEEAGVNVHRSFRYSDNLPEQLKRKIEDMLLVDQKVLDRIRNANVKSSKSDFNESNTGVYELYVRSHQYGKFINISKSVYTVVNEQYSEQMEYYCYDSETFKELELKDIFTPGYDYKPVVLKAIREQLSPSADWTEEAVYDNISGFNLSSDELYIPIQPSKQNKNAYMIYLYIPYSEFGFDHLTIFN